MPTKTLRQDMPVEAWDDLARLAAAAGQTIGIYSRAVLLAHIGERVGTGAMSVQPSASPSRESVTPAEWQHLLAWVKADPARLSTYDGPRKNLSTAERVRLYVWCREQGMPGPLPTSQHRE